jgi:hypothetical protein
VIEVEQTAEPFPSNNTAIHVDGFGRARDQSVLDSLVISLSVVVLDELADYVPKMSLAEGYDPIEALAPNGQNESFKRRHSDRGSVAGAG